MTQPLWRGPKTGFSPREGVTRPIHGRMEASAQYVLKCTNVMHFGLVGEGQGEEPPALARPVQIDNRKEAAG